MTAINLRKGLEFLAYFGEQDFNPQRNLLQDHSGYGRHATAKGGPTVGVNGPNDFEAVSFNAGGDKITYPDPLTFQEQTLFALVKHADSGENKRVFNNGVLSVEFFGSDDDRLAINFRDGSGNTVQLFQLTDSEKWYRVIIVYDGTQLRVFLNSELIASRDVSDHTLSSGRNTSGTGQGPGTNEAVMDLSVFGRWSRAVSDAEIEALNDLTAPRRSQL